MTKRQFEQILKSGEGAMVEFKKTVSSALGREISALANTAGGRIFVGIDDKNDIIGCKLTNQVKSRVQDIANNCDPRVSIKIKSFKYKDKELIVITVPESVDKPIQCSDGFFLREGANSQKMTRNEIFYWAQKTRKIRYESQLREDFQYPGDFNEERFIEFMKKMNVTITGQPEDMLANLGLGENKKGFIINNAGIMLFGHKRRDLYIRQVYVTCVLYKGTNKVKIIDRKDFRDGLVQDYENAFKFLQQHLRLEYVIEGGKPRKEIPEIPYDALKEALLNAIIHRDYFEIGARVMVEIFDDRVEISNPGELLVDEKEFGKKVISVARNPVLFDIFHRLQLIEKVGTGVQRIIDAIQARKLSIEFYFGSFFSITFFRPVLPGHQKDIPGLLPDKIAKIPLEKVKKDIAETGQVPDKFVKRPLEIEPVDAPRKYPASTPQVPRKYPASTRTPHDLDILSFCKIPRKRSDIQEHISLKDREYLRLVVLKPLLEHGLLTPLIPDKPKSSRQKYVITEKGKELLEKSPDTVERPSLDKNQPKEYEVVQPGIESLEAPRKYPASTPQVPRKYPASTRTPHDLEVLSFCETPRKRNDIQEHISLKDREHFRLIVLKPLLEHGLLTPLIPGKPKSSRQKYVITEKGKKLLKKIQD